MRKKAGHKFSLHRGGVQESKLSTKAQVPEEKPIPEALARLINQRAAGLNPPLSFGTPENPEAIGFESLLPAIIKTEIPAAQPTVTIGNHQCDKPYQASLLNCSALSFGPMGKNFILALNKAAYRGNFFQNTGEAGLSPYHFGVDIDIDTPNFDMDTFIERVCNQEFPETQEAGDLVWQIGNGYFGCRGINGSFDPEQFRRKACLPSVKMLEIKLSQGVEPCKKMPVKQVTSGMTKIMGIRWDTQAKLQDGHSSFDSPIELIHFAQQLRVLSGGKPVGIKMGISHKHYFMAICKAMLKTGIFLDFITVDGMEAGTAAATSGALGYTGTPLNDAILFVHNTLVGTRLRHHIKIIASGRVFTEKDMIAKFARGADLCSTARGLMLAVGCDQQRECYLGSCTKGIATQDPELLKNFPIGENTDKLYHYHKTTLQELAELTSIAGLNHPGEFRPYHLQRRVSATEVKTLDEAYEFLREGALLSIFNWGLPASYRKAWHLANCQHPFA